MESFTELVRRLHEQKEYRPVSVTILYRQATQREFLIVESAKQKDAWFPPQEGIEPSESLEAVLSRGLPEELGINFQTDVVDVIPAYYFAQLDAESTRADKRGFTKGKAYIASAGKYIGDGKLILQPEELAAAQWMNYATALYHFNLGRSDKARLSQAILDGAIRILE